MKSLLMFNYNFLDPVISEEIKKTYIKENGNLYIFYEVDNVDLETLELVSQNSTYYSLIKNTKGSLITEYQNKKYLLFKVDKKKYIEEKDISFNQYIESDDSIEWSKLWQNKIDTINNIINRCENKYLLEMKDYYIGMGETAIAFLNYNKENIRLHQKSLCRKRINEEIYRYPTNVIVDYKERDIAGYIKYIFFNKNAKEEDILNILEKVDYRQMDIILIFSRLLFPSYYFDILEKHFENEIINEEDMKIIIKKIDDYEIILKKIFNKYLENINRINWIEKARE